MNNNKFNMLNMQEKDILLYVFQNTIKNQRTLAEETGYSLGIVNRSLKRLMTLEYLTQDGKTTKKAEELMNGRQPVQAVILAAGLGMRMLPINTEVPKGLVKVRGEVLIERLICQLKEAGISRIYIVVGFMKEQYEYLMDKYQVQLLVNPAYSRTNNLHSLALMKGKLEQTYILPCDIWCERNPFHKYELYSWYMVSDLRRRDSEVRMNRKYELVRSNRDDEGNRMIGVAYLQGDDSSYVEAQMQRMIADEKYENAFWEEALWKDDVMVTWARCVPEKSVFELDTYEQLRELDAASDHLNSKVISLIAGVFRVNAEDVKEIRILKKGMTNRSFLFRCGEGRYIMRIPGEGTDRLINRAEEYSVYEAVRDLNLSDDVYYMDAENGCKITRYYEHARVCDAGNVDDVGRCMEILRRFHGSGCRVEHSFDLFKNIEYYETLWGGVPSVWQDYDLTKKKVYELKAYIEEQNHDWALTHIDAVPDNFLFLQTGEIRLIDWEYAGMQDPHVDIAMFAIYSMYDREEIERLIDIYFEGDVDPAVRLKIYCYIAVCGLLWSNWCEYKRQKGVEFGEYSLRQYRYAKDYYRIFCEERDQKGDNHAHS